MLSDWVVHLQTISFHYDSLLNFDDYSLVIFFIIASPFSFPFLFLIWFEPKIVVSFLKMILMIVSIFSYIKKEKFLYLKKQIKRDSDGLNGGCVSTTYFSPPLVPLCVFFFEIILLFLELWVFDFCFLFLHLIASICFFLFFVWSLPPPANVHIINSVQSLVFLSPSANAPPLPMSRVKPKRVHTVYFLTGIFIVVPSFFNSFCLQFIPINTATKRRAKTSAWMYTFNLLLMYPSFTIHKQILHSRFLFCTNKRE